MSDVAPTMGVHRARPEGEEPWLHRLPNARVVKDRAAWIVGAARGRRVAHLGFADVGCEVSRGRDGSWLHAKVATSALSLVGLDVVPDAVAAARLQGFQAHEVDCTRSADIRALGLDPFDVVLVGELIEHVDDAGGLVEAAGELAAADGMLILSTPNARRLMDVLLAAAGREILHPDHVAIYSARTLSSMLNRHGWDVVELLVYLNPRPIQRPRTAKEALLRIGHEIERALAVTVSPYLGDGLIAVARRTPKEGRG